MRYFGFFVLLSMTALSPAGAMAEGNWIVAPEPSTNMGGNTVTTSAATAPTNWIAAPPPSAEALAAASAAEPAVAAAEEKKDDGTCKAKEGEKEGKGASKDGGKDGGKGEKANNCEKVEWPTLTGKDGKGPWTADSAKQQLMQTDPEYAKTLTDADFANKAKEYNNNLSAVGTPESWGLDSVNTAAPTVNAPSTDDFSQVTTNTNSDVSGPWNSQNTQDLVKQLYPNETVPTGVDLQNAVDTMNTRYANDADGNSPYNYGLAGSSAYQVDVGSAEVPASLQYGSNSATPDFTGGGTASSGNMFSNDTFDGSTYSSAGSTGGSVAQNLASAPSYSYSDYVNGQNTDAFAGQAAAFTNNYIGTASASPDVATVQSGGLQWTADSVKQVVAQTDPSYAALLSKDQLAQMANDYNANGVKVPISAAQPQVSTINVADAGSVDVPAYLQYGSKSPTPDFSGASSTGGSSTGGTVAQNLASVPSYTYKDYYLSNNANVPVFQEVPTGTSAAQPDTAATPALVLPAGAKPPVTTPAIRPVVPAAGTLAGLNPAGMMANPGGMTNMLGGLLSGLSQSGSAAANASTPVTTPDAQGCYYVASGQKMCGGKASSDSSATSSNSAVTTANSKGCYFVASGSFVCPETDISKLSSDCFKSSAKWMCPSEFGSSYSSEDEASATFKAGYVDGQQGKLIDSTYVNDTTYLQAYYTGQQDRQTLGIQ